MSVPVEDGLHLLSVSGPPQLSRGTRAEVQARSHEALRAFPGVPNPRLRAGAEMASSVVASRRR